MLAFIILFYETYVSMLFSQIIPPLPSPTESKRLFYTSVSLWCPAYRVIVTFFLNSIYMRWTESEVAQSCPTGATPWTVAYQAPLSVGFSRQECWSGLPFPSPGDLPNPGIEPGSPTLQADALPSEPSGNYTVLMFSFLAYFTLYNRLQFHLPH